jgi:hypothetical protein
LTQASNVIAVVSESDAAFGTVTLAVPLPLNTSAPPKRPDVVRVTPVPSVPVLFDADASAVVVPLVSLNPYAATSPVGCAFDTVTDTSVDKAIFPAASRARAVSVCDPFDAPVVVHVVE